MFFYELFIGLPVRETFKQDLLSIYVEKETMADGTFSSSSEQTWWST